MYLLENIFFILIIIGVVIISLVLWLKELVFGKPYKPIIYEGPQNIDFIDRLKLHKAYGRPKQILIDTVNHLIDLGLNRGTKGHDFDESYRVILGNDKHIVDIKLEYINLTHFRIELRYKAQFDENINYEPNDDKSIIGEAKLWKFIIPYSKSRSSETEIFECLKEVDKIFA